MTDLNMHRTAALASRAKTRIKQLGKRGLTDVSEDEALAMAKICDLVLEDHVNPRKRGEPDLDNKPAIALETK